MPEAPYLQTYRLFRQHPGRGEALDRAIARVRSPVLPGDSTYLQDLMRLWEARLDRVRAREVARDGVGLCPDDPFWLNQGARLALKCGGTSEAEVLLCRALRLTVCGGPREAEGLPREALRLPSGRAKLRISLGQALLHQGQLEMALRILQSLLRREPDNVVALALLVQTQIRRRRFLEARQILDDLRTRRAKAPWVEALASRLERCHARTRATETGEPAR